MTTNRDLLATILAYPDDDAPRLVYADWLEEYAGAMQCPSCEGDGYAGKPHKGPIGHSDWLCVHCGRKSTMFGHGGKDGKPKCPKCASCNGAGYVSNGNEARAEFIRVQCELALVGDTQDQNCRRSPKRNPHGDAHGYIDTKTMKPMPCVDCWAALRARERELLLEEVESQDEYPRYRWELWSPKGYWGFGKHLLYNSDFTSGIMFRRGMVEVVKCTAEQWKQHHAAIRAECPITEVRLTTPLERLDRWPSITFTLAYPEFRGTRLSVAE